MCGRFTQHSSRDRLQTRFGTEIPATYRASFNIAPTQNVLAIAERGGNRRAALLKWGLIPAWSDDPTIGSKMINARSETVTEKPAFRDAFRSRRCLIPADGFYEWLKRGGDKIPYFIRQAAGEPFALAGLWETNEKTGERIASCTILTTDANELMASIHHRMPVILTPEDYEHWLDPAAQPDDLMPLLRPYESNDLILHPVSKRVNSPRNNDPDLIEPIEDTTTSGLFDAISD